MATAIVRCPAPSIPTTATGTVEMLLKVPSPRCPESPTPQHCTVPSPSSAHECASPLTTLVALVRSLTGTGTEELVKLPSPLPSCPKLFRPQHCTVPSGRRIHVCKPPAATAVGVRAPLAVNCWVWPTPMVGFAGATARASADRKTRVTDFVVLMVTAQVAPAAVSHPLQIPRVDPPAGLAVRATLVPLS